MSIRRWFYLSTVMLLGSGCASRAPREPVVARAVDRAFPARSEAALVVGVIDGDDSVVVGRGRISSRAPRRPDGDTVFLVGSVTKVFTGLLLADAVVAGRVRLNGAAQQLLPDVPIPTKDGVSPTLEQLATHSSGLPHMFDNWTPSPAELSALLGQHVPTKRAGEDVAYSNVGYTLLGDAVARAWGTSYEAAMRARITGPLDMTSTGFMWTNPPDRRAQGYDSEWKAVPDSVNVPTMAPCCALESTAHDLMRLLHVYVDDPPSTPPAFALAARPVVRGTRKLADRYMALGWFVGVKDGVVSKSGYMSGYRATVMFESRSRRGVVVLANQSSFDSEKLATTVLQELSDASVAAK